MRRSAAYLLAGIAFGLSLAAATAFVVALALAPLLGLANGLDDLDPLWAERLRPWVTAGALAWTVALGLLTLTRLHAGRRIRRVATWWGALAFAAVPPVVLAYLAATHGVWVWLSM